MKKRFKALEVDHIVFACRDRHFWQEKLERFGFTTLPPKEPRESDFLFGFTTLPEKEIVRRVAMVHGNVRIVLVDPESHAVPHAIENFLLRSGDMQIYHVAIRVDDIEAAKRELEGAGSPYNSDLPPEEFRIGKDEFGFIDGRVLIFMAWHPFFRGKWEFIERPDGYAYSDTGKNRSTGVDHFAIAVSDVEEWEKIYHSFGFETIYEPDLIKGQYSAMKTLAVQRDSWVVALVEGVDDEMPSQVTNYHDAHGEHSVQHAALNFRDLPKAVSGLLERGVQFRLRRDEPDLMGDLTDIIHEGEDHSGPLFQSFTKPWAMNDGKGGFFFEIIRRLSARRKATKGKSAFDDRTVIGLYESIEREELAGDTTLVFLDLTN